MSRRILGEDGPWNDPHADYDPTEAHWEQYDREIEWAREAEAEAKAAAVVEQPETVAA